MRESRRKFLVRATAGVVGAAAASRAVTGQKPGPVPTPVPQQAPVAGMPPAFGTAPPVGPEITRHDRRRSPEARARRVHGRPSRPSSPASWQRAMASTMERRTGPRKLALETSSRRPHSGTR